MEKSFFKKCWENKRTHAFMVLMIWIIVLAFLMGIFYIMEMVSSPKEIEKEQSKTEEKQNVPAETPKEKITYYDKLLKLAASDYEFTYLITENKEKVRFEGTKENSIIVGYKQTESNIIKYKIENQKIFQILIDKEIEISNLYDNIDASLLDLNYLIGILNQISENDIIKTEEEMITIYNYNLAQDEEELEITVIENEKSIESISIHRNNETYELMYNEK